MTDQFPKDKYQAAFDEAAMELEKIHREFETLSLRRERIAKVVEVLKPKASFDQHVPAETMSLTTRRASLTVVTRIAILEKAADS